mmetsp:Transcript_56397/g.135319  ORF Transcript_56397/g.135319 Transcript_56397/m.135319 type:complete len:396 (+) Transcript_56397:63-1250(+)
MQRGVRRGRGRRGRRAGCGRLRRGGGAPLRDDGRRPGQLDPQHAARTTKDTTNRAGHRQTRLTALAALALAAAAAASELGRGEHGAVSRGRRRGCRGRGAARRGARAPPAGTTTTTTTGAGGGGGAARRGGGGGGARGSTGTTLFRGGARPLPAVDALERADGEAEVGGTQLVLVGSPAAAARRHGSAHDGVPSVLDVVLRAARHVLLGEQRPLGAQLDDAQPDLELLLVGPLALGQPGSQVVSPSLAALLAVALLELRRDDGPALDTVTLDELLELRVLLRAPRPPLRPRVAAARLLIKLTAGVVVRGRLRRRRCQGDHVRCRSSGESAHGHAGLPARLGRLARLTRLTRLGRFGRLGRGERAGSGRCPGLRRYCSTANIKPLHSLRLKRVRGH